MPDFKKQDGTIVTVHESRVQDFLQAFPDATQMPGKELPPQKEEQGVPVEGTAAPKLTATVSPSADISLDLAETAKTGTDVDTLKFTKPKTEAELKLLYNNYNDYTSISDDDLKEGFANNYFNIDNIKGKWTVTPGGGFYAPATEADIKKALGDKKYSEYTAWKETGEINLPSSAGQLEELKNQIRQKKNKNFLLELSDYDRVQFSNYIDQKNKKIELASENLINKRTELEARSSEIDEKISIFENQIDSIDNELKAMQDQYGKISGLDSPNVINRYNNLLEERKKIIDNNSGLIKSLEQLNKDSIDYNNTLKSYDINPEEYINNEAALELAKLNYSAVDLASKNLEKFFLGGAAMVGETFASAAEKLRIIDKATLQELSNVAINYNDELSKSLQKDFPARLELSEVNSNNLGRYFAETLADQSGSIASAALPWLGVASKSATVLAATRNISTAAFGISSYGAKRSEMKIAQINKENNLNNINKELKRTDLTEQERAELEEQKSIWEDMPTYSESQMIFAPLLFAGIEMGAERISAFKQIDVLTDMSKTISRSTFSKSLRAASMIPKGILIEEAEELVTQVGQNIVDIVGLKEDKSVFEGIDAEFFVKTAITSFAIGGPGHLNNYVEIIKDEFRTAEDKKNIAKFLNKFELLGKEFNAGNITRKEFNKKRKEILSDLWLQDKIDLRKVNNLTAQQIEEVAEANRIMRKQLRLASEIGANTKLSEEYKQQELLELKNKYVKAQISKNKILKQGQPELSVEAAFYTGLYNLNKDILFELAPEGSEVKIFTSEQESKEWVEANLPENQRGVISDNAFTDGKNIYINEWVIQKTLGYIGQEAAENIFGKYSPMFAAVSPVHELFHLKISQDKLFFNNKLQGELKWANQKLRKALRQKFEEGKVINQEAYDAIIQRLNAMDEAGKADIEEYFTAISDAQRLGLINKSDFSLDFAMKSLVNKALRLINPRANIFGNIRTAEDAFNYIEDFNRSAQSKKIFLGGGIEEDEIKASKDIKQGIDKFVQNPDGTKKYQTKQEFEASEDYISAYEAITQSNLLDGLIMQGMTEKGVTGPAMQDFVQEVKDDLTTRFVKNFDPAKNESLFGWLTGKKGVLNFAKTAVQTRYVKTKGQETGLETEIGGEVITRDLIDEDILIDETIDLETSEDLEASTLIEPLNALTKDNQIKKQFVSIVAEKIKNIKVEDLNYKTLKDLAPDLTNKIFGKRTSDKQEFIRNNAKLLYDLLPMGAMKMAIDRTKSATGIQRSLLMAFYDKGERVVQRDEIKKGIAGTAAGLNEQTKKPFYKPEFLSLFGANEGQAQDRNQVTAIKALQKEIGKAITNRVVRQALESENIPAKVLFRIADGKSKIMASKGLNLSILKLEQYHNDVEILSAALTRFSKTINGVEVKKNSKEIKEFVKESLAAHVDNFSTSTKLLLLYSLSGTGRDKIESTLGARYAIFPTIKSAANFLNIDKKILDQIDLDDYNSILSYAGIKAITAKKNLNKTKKILERLKNKDKELINIIEKENSTKEKALKIFINDLIKVAKINENAEKSIYHILNIQDNYTLHAVRALHPLISFTDPSVLNADERFHDEHFSRSKRTAAYISTIIKNAIDGETADITDSKINLLWRGMYRGIITKTQGDKFSSSKDFGPQTYISQSPLYEMNDNIEDGDLHYFLPNTTLNPYKEIKTLNELLDGLAPIKFAKSENKKLRVFDFDDTLARSASNVLYTMPNGTKGKLTAEQFANRGDDLAEQGAKFDFSEFSKVVKGRKGPLFNVAKAILDKRGNEDLFILTARPEDSKYAIQEFLKELGLKFKIDNITGLGNSNPQAKANWIASKLNEGYNDVYFADDALKNVKAVNETLSSYGIKYRTQAVKASKGLSLDFNKILEQSTGVKFTKQFSPVQARVIGKGKGKKFFIPYSADDFVGLLYATLGRKEVGDQQMEWYKENLIRPFSRGIQQYEAAKQKALREWQILKKQAKENVPGGLDKVNATGLTNQDAVRLYIWNKQGMEIPGVKGDAAFVNDNLKIVQKSPELKAFAERLIALNPEGYPEPSPQWDSGDITTDIVSYINGVKRSEFLTEWKKNADEIFSDKNKEKLRALYGDNYIEALEDILHRMRTGTNRKFGISKVERQFMDWTNNSVGAIMFFNARSAVLQTLSAVNFINFTDNNPINAGLALANFPQYIDDFTELFNSDFLKQRRSGLQTDVNADEIARAAKGAKNTARAVLSALLKFGFTPTQIADSFAIASGGATFYRNRIKTYMKEGMSEQDAKAKAFTDFQEIAEETQQSARPDRISLQQASSLGRLILAFGNTPMQYARLTKKATLDLINGRGDWKTNISKIMYYSVIQNIIFSALQQGLFALLFDDEDDDKEKSRLFRIGNSSLDTLLRGVGVYGAAAATVKNMILEIIDQQKSGRPNYTEVVIEATAISPPINSKLRKLNSAGKTFTYKQSKEKVFTEGFSLENPALLATGQIISALTNLPADRVVQKADHIYTAMQPETELWQAIALSLGWSEWDLNMIKKDLTQEDIEKKLRKIERILNKI